MANNGCGTAGPRSRFVTVVAWLSIALCALCALTTGVDTLLLVAMAGNEGLQAGLAEVPAGSRVSPELAALVTSGAAVPWFSAVTAACVGGLIVSVALLKRCEWGRKLFVWLVLTSIPLTWAGAIAAHALAWPVSLVVMSYALALVVTGVHLWLARELGRDTVRAEFAQPCPQGEHCPHGEEHGQPAAETQTQSRPG